MNRADIIASQKLVADVFRELRPELLVVFGNIEFSRKDNHSPVTEWDVRVENKLRDALAEQFPSLGFEGEETGAHGSREHYWLVDPIDGTSSFIRGLDYSTNMAALVVGEEVVAAVIYDFVRDHLYTAVKGEGAFKDGKQIHVNQTRQAMNWLMYSFTRDKFALVREALQEVGVRTVLPMGAAGHTYVLLAEGKIDGAIALGTGMGSYDNAPGVLIAEEAGAEMLSYDDEKGVNRHEFIIGAPSLIKAIETSGLL